MSIAVIINPAAGRARPGDARVRGELAAAVIERSGETADIAVTQHRGHARLLAEAAVRRGARLVLVWGGDGTINEVATALAFGTIPLGLIPAGSGNGLARELGAPTQPAQAISRAMDAKPRSVDLGEMGGRIFVNLAGIGLDAHVASRFNEPGGKSRGFARYVAIAARALATYVPREYVISAPDVHIAVRALIVAVANSRQYGNGAQIAPAARIDDGLLDVVVIGERSRLATLWRTRHLFDGTVDRIPECSTYRVRDVRIECPEPILFHVDGEPVGGGNLITACIHPGALRIAVG